ncbi:hypothetical protein ANCCAN_23383 [Ancylostoma caninum]|uniref:Sugar phosphate transporter domain-containing protein n=1 Tax=Ancylostoma caninum TaxID=29170 RepID=A0A368FFA7_ANCCA|nr:hypothetical protein ANCCAN_23383 [Ancylostoma caninum]
MFQEEMADDRDLTKYERYIKVVAAVSAYWVCSIGLVFLNKYLLSSEELKLNAPLFITWFQCVVTVVLCFLLSFVSRSFPNTINFPRMSVDAKISREVLPLSIVFVAMISFNNLCLKYVGVSFYYIGRCLTTVFNVICTYLILGQKTSARAIGCCFVIIAGFLLGVDQEDASGESCEFFVRRFFSVYSLSIVACSSRPFFCIYSFQATSALTHNISGTAKAAAQTVMAVIYFSEIKTFMWWASNVIVLFGSAAYTYVKKQEMDKKAS